MVVVLSEDSLSKALAEPSLLMDTKTEWLSNANPLSAGVSLHGLINDSYKWLDMDVTNLKRYSVIHINNQTGGICTEELRCNGMTLKMSRKTSSLLS